MTYYQLLEIQRNSSIDEIKKSYKRLAILCHPDKNNGNDTKFKELNEAYSTLSNEHKKSEYDKKLAFSNTFNRWGSAFGKSKTAGKFHKEKNIEIHGEHINHILEFTHDTHVYIIPINRVIKCALCDGTGAKTLKSCSKCNGKGIYRLPPYDGIDRVVDCEACNTSGKCIDIVCDVCKGIGGMMSIDNIEVNISESACTGDTMVYNGKGHAGRNGASCGNLVLTLIEKEIKKHTNYEMFDMSADEYEKLNIK